MSPDVLTDGHWETVRDPRHGTVAGYNRIPCREDCCKLAMARYKKRLDWDKSNGRDRIVPTIGTRRRVQALNRLGWSSDQIAREAGVSRTNMTRLLYHGDTMTSAVAARFADVYERLSMSHPRQTEYATRTRRRAEAHGWPPPLAWDDIDDPDEQPATGWKPVRNRPAAELFAELDHLTGLGVSEYHAAKQLGITVDAIEKARERAGGAA